MFKSWPPVNVLARYHYCIVLSHTQAHTIILLFCCLLGFLFKERWSCKLNLTQCIYDFLHHFTATLGDFFDTVAVGVAPFWLSKSTGAWSSSKQWQTGPDPGACLPSNCAIVHHHSQARGPAWPISPLAISFDFDRRLVKENLSLARMLACMVAWLRNFCYKSGKICVYKLIVSTYAGQSGGIMTRPWNRALRFSVWQWAWNVVLTVSHQT